MGFMSDNANRYLVGNQVDKDKNTMFIFIWNSEEHYEDIPLNTNITVEGIDVYDGHFKEEILAKDFSLIESKKDCTVELFGSNKFYKVLYCDSELILRFESGRLDWGKE